MENSDAFNTAPILLSKINDLGKQIEDIECVNIVNSTITNKIETNIDGIKKDIHDIDFRNRVDACIRNVKIFGRFMQLLCPYILAVSLAFGTTLVLGDNPFIREKNVHVPKHYEMSVDEKGNSTTDSWYEKDANNESSFYFYGEWRLEDDGKYHRSVTEYTTNMKKNGIGKVIRDYYGERGTILPDEIRDEISEKDLYKDFSIAYTYRYDDDKDFILEEQSEEKNDYYKMLFIIFSVVYSIGSTFYRFDYSDFDFTQYCKKYIDGYKPIDLSEVKRQFSEKRKEYERIKKGNIKQVDIDDICNAKTYRKA